MYKIYKCVIRVRSRQVICIYGGVYISYTHAQLYIILHVY